MEKDLEQILNSGLPLVLEYDETYGKTDMSVLEELCKQEIPAAIGELAVRYHEGTGGAEKNSLRAFALYQDLLKYQRNAWALTWMGILCEEGEVGEEKREDCIEYYMAASMLGSGHGTVQLGLLYDNGKGVEKDIERAREYFRLAIQQGYKSAYYNLGSSYYKSKQYDKAKIHFEKVANEEPGAYIMLGIMYEEGLGVPRDGQKAMGMYRLAYKHGLEGSGALYQGKLYYYGEVVEEDNKKALELFREALQWGETGAKYYIGTLYGIGIEDYLKPDLEQALQYLSAVPEDYVIRAETTKGQLLFYAGRVEEAKEVLEKAAAEGSEQAKEFLQENILKERTENVREKLEQMSAQEIQALYEQGNIDAAFYLGLCYKLGRKGVQQDAARAISLFEEVVQSGEDRRNFGYCEIAQIFYYGYGVPIDYEKAFRQ